MTGTVKLAMDGLNASQFRRDVIAPVLHHIGLWSPEAETLLLGTAMVESRLHFIRQLKSGPALSVFQIEPPTYHDVFNNFLRFRPELREKVESLRSNFYPHELAHLELLGNMNYATAIARIVYRRAPGAIPVTAAGMAHYYKRHYNTVLGASTVEGSTPFFERAMGVA
jgi:hypothetical protein